MSYAEYLEWGKFYELEPFGNEERMFDARHGTLCSLVVNALGSESKPIDFMMYEHEKKEKIEEMNEEQIKEAQSVIFQIFTMG